MSPMRLFADEVAAIRLEVQNLRSEITALKNQNAAGIKANQDNIGLVLSEMRNVQHRLLASQGALLRQSTRAATTPLEAEFKVFSQWGEDGIINYLLSNVEIPNKTFIEFGVEDFSEANCRFLLEDRNWTGFIIDGSPQNMGRIKGWRDYWKYNLTAHSAFITRDNISALLDQSGFDRDLGILSIDLDGVDYWVADSLKNWRPRILILEYNAVFGPDRLITVPYNENFNRTEAHHSNLYWGASLGALTRLATDWGYGLVCTNSAGNNAFFVRRDLLGGPIRETSVAEAFTASNFRESRDETGQLTFLSGHIRLQEIAGLPVYNIETQTLEPL